MAAEGGAGAAVQAGQAVNGWRENNRSVLLALAIMLLWLAGVAFFFAFEGVQAPAAGTTGGGLLRAMIGGIAARAQARETAPAGQGG